MEMLLNIVETCHLKINRSWKLASIFLTGFSVLAGCATKPSADLYNQCKGSAVYSVNFDSTWSASSHPTDFPNDPHFSELIGAVHNNDIRFLEDGQLASAGVKDVAEIGSNIKFKKEIAWAIKVGTAKSVINGPDIKTSPGSANVEIRATGSYSRVTLLSMIAPSPDWILGVSGFDLCENGAWIQNKTVSLNVYDAGTDDGTTYTAENKETNPRMPVTVLTSGIHNEDGVISRLGTLTFDLIATGLPIQE